MSAYEEMFGPLPEIWFTDAVGALDTTTLVRYRETGVVVAEWDCSPTGGGDGEAVPGRREAVTR